MFKQVLLSLISFLSISAFAAEDKVVLSKDNTVVLNWVVNDQSVAQLTNKILQLSQSVPKNKPIYLVLDTPGGSVMAGTSLIDALRGVEQEVKTVNLFSASMGFQIAQNLGERIATKNTTMMSHQAAGGIDGTIPGSLNERLNFNVTLTNSLDVVAAKRLKISLEKYQARIQNEYWTYGEDTVKQNVTDRIATVVCDDSLKGTSTTAIQTMFGEVEIEQSNCPMARGIISARLARQNMFVALDEEVFRRALFLLTNDKVNFIHQFITTGKFSNVGF